MSKHKTTIKIYKHRAKVFISMNQLRLWMEATEVGLKQLGGEHGYRLEPLMKCLRDIKPQLDQSGRWPDDEGAVVEKHHV